MLAVSSSWNADRRYTTRGFFDVITKLGFSAIELSYFHEEGEIKEILECCRSEKVQIASVHNFCPMPGYGERNRAKSELLLLSSKDESERRLAVEGTKRSIHTTASLGAGSLIIHSGRVGVPEKTTRLIDLYRNGKLGTKGYERLRSRFVGSRARRSEPFFSRFIKSLEQLCPAAGAAGVELAIESRFYYSEIPSFEELGKVMEIFRDGPVGYWHDIGHTQVMENLGFWRHEDLLDTAGDRLLGFHIHDVLLCEDHLPPSAGMVRFERFKRFLRPDVLKVVELSPAQDPGSVEKGIRYIDGIMGD